MRSSPHYSKTSLVLSLFQDESRAKYRWYHARTQSVRYSDDRIGVELSNKPFVRWRLKYLPRHRRDCQLTEARMDAHVRMSQECACRRWCDNCHPMSIHNLRSEGALSVCTLLTMVKHRKQNFTCPLIHFFKCVHLIVAMNWIRSQSSHSPSAGRSPASHKRRSMVKCESCRKKRIKV